MASLDWNDQPSEVGRAFGVLDVSMKIRGNVARVCVYRGNDGEHYVTVGNIFRSETVCVGGADEVLATLDWLATERERLPQPRFVTVLPNVERAS